MSFRSTLIMFIVLAVLCAGYYAMEHFNAGEAQRIQEAKQLFDFSAQDVRTLEIARIGEAPTVAEQDGDGKWRMTQPDPEIDAFSPLWTRVSETFSKLLAERALLTAEKDPSLYGLTEPVLKVTAALEGGDEIAVSFGDLEPTKTFRYAQLNGDTLFLVNKDQYFELDRSLELLRNQFVTDQYDAPLLRIEVAQVWAGDEGIDDGVERAIGETSPPVVFQRANADAPWRILAPEEAPADQEKVNALAAELQASRGYKFIDNPQHLSDYGLAPPKISLRFMDNQAGEMQQLFLGGIDKSESPGGIFAKRAEKKAVFQVAPELMKRLPKLPMEFRDMHLVTQSLADLNGVVIDGADTQVTLEQPKDGAWRVAKPALDDADQGRISAFISRLKNASGAEVVEGSPADYGLDEPDWTFTLTFPDQASAARVRIGHVENSDGTVTHYAQQDTGTLMGISDYIVAGLEMEPRRFRSLRMMTFDRSEAIKVSLLFEDTNYLFEKVHGQWLVREPEGKRLANQSDMPLILDQFDTLEALDLEAKDLGDDPQYGLEPPTLRFAVTLRDDNGAETELGPVTVGGLVEGSVSARYARVAGRQGVFQVPQELIESIRESLRGVQDLASGN